MKAARRSALVALGLMGAAAAGAVAWKPSAKLADSRAKVDLEQMFPRAFGDWKMDTALPVQLVAPDVQQLLASIYSQTLSRTYVNGKGDRIMLSVAYGGDQSDATRAHRPEVCYPAQGFQVLSNEVGTLAVSSAVEFPVRRLLTRLGGRVEPVTYWMVVGERVAVSGTQQKLLQLGYSTRGLIPDGMLMRVSSIDSDAPTAHAVQQAFVRELAGAVPQDWHARVFGSRSTVESTSATTNEGQSG